MNLSPLETVRRYYGSLAPGRRQVLMELLDSEVVVEVQEGFPGTRRCYIGLKAYVEDFLYALYGSFDLEFIPEEYLDCRSRVVVIGRQKGKAVRTGVPVDVPFVHVWTVQEGHLVNARMFTDTAILRDAVEGHPTPVDAGAKDCGDHGKP
jgi:ketosteroid isomerase-like protein